MIKQIQKFIESEQIDDAICLLKSKMHQDSYMYNDKVEIFVEEWNKFKQGIEFDFYSYDQIKIVLQKQAKELIAYYKEPDFDRLNNSVGNIGFKKEHINGMGQSSLNVEIPIKNLGQEKNQLDILDEVIQKQTSNKVESTKSDLLAKRKIESVRENKKSTLQNQKIYVGFWRRGLIQLTDTVIGFLLLLILTPIRQFFLSLFIEKSIALPVILLEFAYYPILIWLMVKYGGTPGKLIWNVRVISIKGKFLTYTQACVRILPYLIINLVQMYYGLKYIAISKSISIFHFQSLEFYSTPEVISLVQEHRIFQNIMGLYVLVDILLILFNNKKRAIHDYIAGSYVVYKKSIDEFKEQNKE